eukprot:5780410-Amphidinium_carterae.1
MLAFEMGPEKQQSAGHLRELLLKDTRANTKMREQRAIKASIECTMVQDYHVLKESGRQWNFDQPTTSKQRQCG